MSEPPPATGAPASSSRRAPPNRCGAVGRSARRCRSSGADRSWCSGLDPDPGAAVAQCARARRAGPSDHDEGPAVRAGRAVAAHCRLLLEAAGENASRSSPRSRASSASAHPAGRRCSEVVDRRPGARAAGDRRRQARRHRRLAPRRTGRRSSAATATPYGPVPGLGADAADGQPAARSRLARGRCCRDGARRRGRPVAAVAHVQPGCRRPAGPGAAGRWHRQRRPRRARRRPGAPRHRRSGLSDVGAVAGATVPEQLERLRELMPAAVILLPGLGAQGADGRGACAPPSRPVRRVVWCRPPVGSRTLTSAPAAIPRVRGR